MKRGSQTAAMLLWALLLAVCLPAAARAQAVTTAAVSGRVVNAEQAPAAGVQVTATNTANGSVSRVVTRADGRYLLPGLQPGSYRLTVSGLGMATQTRTVNLALGTTATNDFTLASQAISLGPITATAERNAIISSSHTGAATTISDSTLRRAPTISRDLSDFTRLVPQLAMTNSTTGAISAGGRNNRYNQLQIDGTSSNDMFGLSGSGTPSGQAGGKAITLEAVQELQVVLAPFDVRQSGFTGASVNAVTKSGTNRFQGTISGFNRNEGLAGRYITPADTVSSKLDKFRNTEIAGSFGGPIMRNKAFFFLAGERTNRTNPINYIAGSNSALGVTSTQAQQLADTLAVLGYAPGGISGRRIERASTNLFGRLDFNLGQNNRLTLRHNYIDANRGDFGSSARTYYLANAGYTQFSTTNSSVLQLNSGFGGGVFNELRLGYNRVRDHRGFEGGQFPRIQVNASNGNLVAGTENFSGQNILDQDAFEITNDLTIPAGSHTLVFGTSNQFSKFSNLFVRNPFGNYVFQSYADFVAGRASNYQFSYLVPDTDPNTPGDQPGRPRADFGVRRYALYGEDRWDALSNLQVTLGLRVDRNGYPDTPGENTAFAAIYGRHTSAVPENSTTWSPRIGFNWDLFGDQTTQLRGGAGVFSGANPLVWVSNVYGNTGLDYIRFTCDRLNTNNNDDPPPFVFDPANQPRSCVTSAGVPIAAAAAPNEIDLVDPNFRSPQVARYSLGIDRQLPLGLVGTLEGLYTQTIHDVLYQNLRVFPTGLRVENRPAYALRGGTPGFGDVIDLTNTSAGYAYNLTAQLQRQFRNGWDFSLAYTRSKAKDVNPITSSQAISNWQFNVTASDPNNPGLHTSDNDIPNRVVATTSYSLRLFSRASTDLSLVYVGQSGLPYSYRYGSDINGDGSTGNDLVYVPKDASDIRFQSGAVNGVNVTAAQSWENLNDFMNRVPCLNNARGTVLSRNSCRTPWSNRIDFRIAQNLAPIRGQNAQITLDVLNFANLLNREWGLSQFIANQTDNLLSLGTGNTTADANGRRLYRAFAARQDAFSTSTLDSRYQIQLGVRYSF
ncbi:MAG TPA: carboxypeptidase regulatory-like domain-containing protein [Longimicrobiaceae bacterium]|jgi:hypothetical protein|nr:carboxypeptidase regulatory-like domain-containing protein [Longimicrobiaceae bacterium]